MCIDDCLHLPTSSHAGQCSNMSECYSTYCSTPLKWVCARKEVHCVCMYVIINTVAALLLDVTVPVRYTVLGSTTPHTCYPRKLSFMFHRKLVVLGQEDISSQVTSLLSMYVYTHTHTRAHAHTHINDTIHPREEIGLQ